MSDKPISEHPDVQRLIVQIIQLQEQLTSLQRNYELLKIAYDQRLSFIPIAPPPERWVER